MFTLPSGHGMWSFGGASTENAARPLINTVPGLFVHHIRV